MKKKLLALLCAVMCISMTACGKKDSSSEKDTEDKDTTTTTTTAAADADDASSEEKADDEESKPEDTSSEDEKAPDSSKADESTADTPDYHLDGGTVIKGTGYSLEVSDKWIDVGANADALSEEVAGAVEDQLGVSTDDFEGMDIFLYYDDGDLTDGAPALTVVKPTYEAMFESLTINDVAELLSAQFETQFSSIEGATLESRGVVKYGDGEFLELYTAYDLPEAQARARQFYTFHKGYQYIVSFSSTPELYDEVSKEADEIMKTFKFTEG